MLPRAMRASLSLARQQALEESDRNRLEAQMMDAERGKFHAMAAAEEDAGLREAKMMSLNHAGMVEKERRRTTKTAKRQAWNVKDVVEVLQVRKEDRRSLEVLRGTEGQALQHMRADVGLDVRVSEDEGEISIRFSASGQGRALFSLVELSEEEQLNQLRGTKETFKRILENTQALRDERQSRSVHVLIDWSNIVFGVGSRAASTTGSVNAKRLAALLEQDERVLTQFMATSTHPALDPGTAVFHRLGYMTHVEPRGKEAFVDGSLQINLMHVANKHYRDIARHTIRLATGDGNMHDEHGKEDQRKLSFPIIVEHALAQGYRVELWTWLQSCSNKYQEMLKHYAPQFSIKYLDNFREYILPSAALDQAEFPPVMKEGKEGGGGGSGRSTSPRTSARSLRLTPPEQQQDQQLQPVSPSRFGFGGGGGGGGAGGGGEREDTGEGGGRGGGGGRRRGGRGGGGGRRDRRGSGPTTPQQY